MSGPPGLSVQQAVDAMSARLIALADLENEDAARAELDVWSGRVGAFAAFRGRPEPVRSLVASMLWLVGKQRDAVGLAVDSIRLGSRDNLSDQIIRDARDRSLRTAYDAIEAKRPDLARVELQHMIGLVGGILDPIEERAALDLLDRIDGIAARRGSEIPVEGRPTLIKLGMWGDRFIDGAASSVLACCLAPGNVPALSDSGTVVLHLHTRARDVERVRALDVVRELTRHARIEIAALPEALFLDAHFWGQGFWSRNILAMAEFDSLMLARDLGADMICLSGDMLLADGCLEAAKARLAAGYEIVLASALRARTEPALAAAAVHRIGRALAIPPDTLYRLSLETMHPALRRQFMRPVPQSTVSDPYQVFFTVPGGFAAHAFHWHPVAFSTRSVPADIGFDSHTIDGRFASDLLAGKDRDAACYLQRSPPDDFYLVSLDASGGVEAFGAFEVSPTAIVQSLAKWVDRAEDIDHFAWLLRQRAFYRVPPDLALDLPAECLDEESAIAVTVDLLEAARPQLLARIDRFVRAPAE